jgi:hypothetical protein
MKLNEILNLQEPQEVIIGSRTYNFLNGILKSKKIMASLAQKQTQETFGFKWKKKIHLIQMQV